MRISKYQDKMENKANKENFEPEQNLSSIYTKSIFKDSKRRKAEQIP